MIDWAEILAIATELSLSHDVVEKALQMEKPRGQGKEVKRSRTYPKGRASSHGE